MSMESGHVVGANMTFKFKQKDGCETIEFIAFNYDGEGSSLAIINGKDFSVYSKKDTKDIVEGPKNNDGRYVFVPNNTKGER